MEVRRRGAPSRAPSLDEYDTDDNKKLNPLHGYTHWHSAALFIIFNLLVIALVSHAILSLPEPLSSTTAGTRAFSEERAWSHVLALERIGVRLVGTKGTIL